MGQVLVHGVAVRPGHPVILGMLDCGSEQGVQPVPRKVPIVGVPGYPVSAALTGEIFVEQVLARWLGRAPLSPMVVPATLTRKVTSPAGDDDYLRVAVGRVGERLLAAPLSRGAGVITSLVRADGLVMIPRGTQGLEAGSPVSVRLYRPPTDLDHTIFTIGSHDLTLDLLAQYLAEHGRRLVSVNAGSLGGLVALRREEAHFAGTHLLDPQTGIYNLSHIHQYLPGVPIRIVGWVGRTQGLLVRKGNPRQITSLQDLVRPDIMFVNRQRGAGTRVLLDYHLSQLGISSEGIQGYQHEEYTHLAVAAAVQSGRADCGLGITAAAQALDLDFVPLFDERYELAIPRKVLEDGLLDPLFEVAQSPAFRQAVSALPGYDLSAMGQVLVDLDG
jgi:putative molybdopterin biosynthesis protein